MVSAGVHRVYRLRCRWCKTVSYTFVVCGLAGSVSVFDVRYLPVFVFALFSFAVVLIPTVYVEVVDVDS